MAYIKIAWFDNKHSYKDNAILRKIPRYFGDKGHNVSKLLSNCSGKEDCVWNRFIEREIANGTRYK